MSVVVIRIGCQRAGKKILSCLQSGGPLEHRRTRTETEAILKFTKPGEGLGLAAAALLAGWAPVRFSIVTVFLFAGPHNWLELRYFLTRLPARWGRLRGFFLLGLSGAVGLTAAVLVVADDRVADRGHVDPDLVRAAGLDLDLEQRRFGPARELAPVRARLLHVDAPLLLGGQGLLVLGELVQGRPDALATDPVAYSRSPPDVAITGGVDVELAFQQIEASHRRIFSRAGR